MAHLSRIVNITELAMKLSDYRNETPRLEVTGIATTYFFVDMSTRTGGE